jgi:ABC-type transport system involved in multi-copper enzyme maturation permease subunit
MTWLTWRQFRSQLGVAAGAIVAIGVALAVAAKIVADLYVSSGAAACRSDCEDVINNFLVQATSGATGIAYSAGVALLYVGPGLIGAFWGAPLVARELEAGTHSLAWNQSVTRTRWLTTKLAFISGTSMATVALLSLFVTWYSSRIDRGPAVQIQPMYFGARGVVPVGYAAFAFAVGVTAGVLIRRTVPAMAATLAVYLAAAAAFPLWIRAHVLPAIHTTVPLDTHHINGLMLEGDNRITVIGDANVSGWLLSNHTITSSGAVFTGPPDPRYCGSGNGPRVCLDWIGTLGLRQSVVYQPASHFWPLQWIESGILLALAAVLLAFCVRRIRRLV